MAVGLVQVAKYSGFPRKYAPALALFLGLVVALADQAGRTWVEFAPWIQASVVGLAAGLSANGLYVTVKKK